MVQFISPEDRPFHSDRFLLSNETLRTQNPNPNFPQISEANLVLNISIRHLVGEEQIYPTFDGHTFHSPLTSVKTNFIQICPSPRIVCLYSPRFWETGDLPKSSLLRGLGERIVRRHPLFPSPSLSQLCLCSIKRREKAL